MKSIFPQREVLDDGEKDIKKLKKVVCNSKLPINLFSSCFRRGGKLYVFFFFGVGRRKQNQV